jgi:WD40 repeat protein
VARAVSRALAARLSRAVVGCYPGRWRQRYREEILDVLDQHQASSRTVLSLAAGAMTAHLDPDYRMERPVIRIRNDAVRLTAQITAAAAAFVACCVLVFVLSNLSGLIRDSSWHLGLPQGTGGYSFTPDQRLLATSGGPPFSGNVTLWAVTGSAGLRRLSVFEGGGGAALSPDGDTVATVAYGGQPALWDVARPRHPRRLAVLFAGASGDVWGQAFSPDGAVLANASTTGLTLWDVARPARPRLLRVRPAPAGPRLAGAHPGPGPGDLAFSPGGTILASVTGTSADRVTLWDVARPARAVTAGTITIPLGSVVSLTFSPDGRLLAVLTERGTLTVWNVADPARPARVAARFHLLTRLRYPEGALASAWPSAVTGGQGGYGVAPSPLPCLDTCFPPAYTAGFGPGGRSLTVVIGLDQQSNADPGRSWSTDTVLTWAVSGHGTLSGPSVVTRRVVDGQPGLAPDARVVADGTPFGSSRPPALWALP